jgi:hypothetical protein
VKPSGSVSGDSYRHGTIEIRHYAVRAQIVSPPYLRAGVVDIRTVTPDKVTILISSHVGQSRGNQCRSRAIVRQTSYKQLLQTHRGLSKLYIDMVALLLLLSTVQQCASSNEQLVKKSVNLNCLNSFSVEQLNIRYMKMKLRYTQSQHGSLISQFKLELDVDNIIDQPMKQQGGLDKQTTHYEDLYSALQALS